MVVVLAAASAVSGCVTVSQRAPGPGPVSGPASGPVSGPAAPSAAARPASPIVQAPAHEVLASVRPEPAAKPKPKAASRQRVAPPAQAERRAAAPAPAKPRHRLRVAAPPAGGVHVCDMGETYGRWAGQSDAARICRQAYGN